MGGTKSKPLPAPADIGSSEEALVVYYTAKVKPMEERHLFADFYSPPIDSAELHAKPSVLILGQYSVGKTSMINYLLGGTEYPGSTIGPEPTTDVFVFVQHAAEVHTIPGPTLISHKDFPFKGLSKFGADFLNKVRGATLSSPLLADLTFVDTPGILSGEKQRTQRGYDFHKVVKFLGEKVDRIWVLFDTSKTDISDEFKLVLNCLVGNDEKIRIILNKADAVKAEELVRVRGALMWNLGKILTTPEVPQVIIGSFWDHELKRTDLRDAFRHDYKKLVLDLHELPVSAPIRKINDIVKRARKVKLHALIMNEILRRGALCGGTAAAVKKWTSLRHMRIIFTDLEIVHKISPYDFPSIEEFALACERSDLRQWRKILPKDVARIDEFIKADVGNIIEAHRGKTAERGGDPADPAAADVELPKNLGGDSPAATQEEAGTGDGTPLTNPEKKSGADADEPPCPPKEPDESKNESSKSNSKKKLGKKKQSTRPKSSDDVQGIDMEAVAAVSSPGADPTSAEQGSPGAFPDDNAHGPPLPLPEDHSQGSKSNI